MSIISDISTAIKKASIAEKIIYINIIFFIVILLSQNIVGSYLTLPTEFNEAIKKPWAFISYAFVHYNILHILSNLIILFYIGNLFLDFFSEKQFINYYIFGILFGAIFFFLGNQLTLNTLPLGGASAGIAAIFIGITTKIPRFELKLRFIGSVELWVLAAIWIGLSILQIQGKNAGGYLSHIGGAIIGFIYTKQLEKGMDIGKWFENSIEKIKSLFKKKETTLKTVYTSKKRVTKEIDDQHQRKINRILDKINASGYESLSKEEKEFLFKAGKQ